MTSQIPLAAASMATRPLPNLLAASGNPAPVPTYGAPSGAPLNMGSNNPSASYAGYGNGALGGNSGGLGGGSYGSSLGGGGSLGGTDGGDYAPAPNPASSYYSAGSAAAPSTNNYGQAPSTNTPNTPLHPSATAAYGVSSLSAYGGLASPSTATPAGGYSNGAAGVQAAYAPSGGSAGPAPRNTQIYGQTLTNWQPALPVSPWGTVERPAASLGGATDTILRSDLKKLKRSRLKAWLYLFIVLGLAGTGGYYGFAHFEKLVDQSNASRDRENSARNELEQLRRVHNETVAKAGGAVGVGASSLAAGAKAGPTGTASAKLAEDLKRVLAGSPQVGVETRGDHVVVSVDGAALFSGKETEVGLGGYRTLYKFGKSLKTVKDRRVAITVPSIEIKKAKAWNLAAARAVSLGRFFTDDLGFERGRVSVSAPAPRPAGKVVSKSGVIGRVEFVLDPI
jgi:hypothetical protein